MNLVLLTERFQCNATGHVPNLNVLTFAFVDGKRLYNDEQASIGRQSGWKALTIVEKPVYWLRRRKRRLERFRIIHA